MSDFPGDGLGLDGAGDYAGIVGGNSGALPQNPLVDLIGGNELHVGHELHGGGEGEIRDGLTVEYQGREYYVNELNLSDPHAHDPNRAPGHGGWGAGANSAETSEGYSGAGGAYSTGVEESVTIADDQGMSILSDTDGDGKVDYVSSVSYDGQWSAWRWIEPAEAEGASSRGNSDTPNSGRSRWETDAWKCVDRGQWG